MSPFLDRQLYLLFWVAIIWGVKQFTSNPRSVTFSELFIYINTGVILAVILQFILDKP
jgi:hypothetical protein